MAWNISWRDLFAIFSAHYYLILTCCRWMSCLVARRDHYNIWHNINMCWCRNVLWCGLRCNANHSTRSFWNDISFPRTMVMTVHYTKSFWYFILIHWLRTTRICVVQFDAVYFKAIEDIPHPCTRGECSPRVHVGKIDSFI